MKFIFFTVLLVSGVTALAAETTKTIYCKTYSSIKTIQVTKKKVVIEAQDGIGYEAYAYLGEADVSMVQMINLFSYDDSKLKTSAHMYVLPGGVTNMSLSIDDENKNFKDPVGGIMCATEKQEIIDRVKYLEDLEAKLSKGSL